MYTKKEVAQFLKLSLSTINKHIAAKRLHVTKLGPHVRSAVRITEEDLKKFIARYNK